MKTSSKLAIVAIAAALLGCDKLTNTSPLAKDRTVELEAQLKAIKDKEDADERLGQYAINQMYKSTNTVKNLSPARQQILARSIVRVANDILETEAEKQAFVSVLQIESQFLRFAQSPTGPRGLTQVTKKTFHGAMKNCGVEDLKDDDVWETDVNLYAGACYFKEQLIMEKENLVKQGKDAGVTYIFSAMVDYNQGPESEDAKMYRKSGDLKGLEPAKYVSKFAYLRSTTTDKVVPGIPSIQELPKPTTPKSSTKASSHKK